MSIPSFTSTRDGLRIALLARATPGEPRAAVTFLDTLFVRAGSVAYSTSAALGIEAKAWLSLPALAPAESFTWDLAAANLIAQYRVVLARRNAAPELIDHVARPR